MNIYIINNREAVDMARIRLSRYGRVIGLSEETGDISKFGKLFRNNDPKVIGISPDRISWQFPLEILKRIENLKGICLTSSWAGFLDVEYCENNGVKITTTTDASSNSVAEYAIWMMLSLAKKLPIQQRDGYKTLLNEKHVTTEIRGKIMGVVGLGRIGSMIADFGKGLGMNIVYWNRSPKETPYRALSLDKMLKQSDFVFNCLEICDGTRGILNADKLALMKPSACLISILGGAGWGPIDDNAAAKMVSQGKLAGFAVENEDEKSYKFKNYSGKNIFGPGTYAWYTEEALERIDQMWFDSMVNVIRNSNL